MTATKTAPSPPPPEHLSARTGALWVQLTVTRARSPERRAMLLTALEALDRADEARRAIAAEGLFLTTAKTGAAHVHPLVKVEIQSQQLFARIWAVLGFNHGKDDSAW